MSEYDADFEMLLQELAGDYLDQSIDQMENVESCIENIRFGRGKRGDNILEIKRAIHSIKGGGSSFGFSSITHICHSFESFIESCDSIDSIDAGHLLTYFDAINAILIDRREPDEEEREMLLKSLPTGRSHLTSSKTYVGSCLVVMPKNLQRKIISQELAQLGLKVVLESDPVSAINTALDLRPEYFVTSVVTDRLSGIETANIIRTISCLKNTKIAILAAGEHEEILANKPAESSVIKKGPRFAKELLGFFELMNV